MAEWEFSAYPPNWDEITRSIRERDRGCCRNCGAGGPALHVHHIVPLLRGGSNAPSNLVTLCEQCHIQVHPHMRRGHAPKDSGFWHPFPRHAIPPFALSPAARELISAKPRVWEYRLLDRVIQDELAVTASLWETTPDDALATPLPSLLDYAALNRSKLEDIIQWVVRLELLMGKELADAMGPPGEPGDSEKIIEVAKGSALFHRELVIWKREIESMTPPGGAARLHELLTQCPDSTIHDCENFFNALHHTVTVGIPDGLAQNRPVNIHLTWKLAPPPMMEEMYLETERLSRALQSQNVPATSRSRPSGCLGALLLALVAFTLFLIMIGSRLTHLLHLPGEIRGFGVVSRVFSTPPFFRGRKCSATIFMRMCDFDCV